MRNRPCQVWIAIVGMLWVLGCGPQTDRGSATSPSPERRQGLAKAPTAEIRTVDGSRTHYPRHEGPSLCDPTWDAGENAVWIRFEDLIGAVRGVQDGKPFLRMVLTNPRGHAMHLPLLWVPLENFADAVGDQPLEENGYAMWDVGNADISLEPSAGSLQFYEPQIATGAVPDAQSAGHFTWVADMETVLGKGRGSIADRHLSRGGDIASTFEVQAGCVSAGWECDRYGEQQKWDFGNRKQKAIADSIVVEMPVPADSPPKIRFRNTTINLKFDGGARTFEIVVGSIPVPRTGMPDPKKMPHYVHFWQFLKNRANFPEPVSQQDPACKAPDALATSVAIGGVTYPLGPNVARCAPIVFTYP